MAANIAPINPEQKSIILSVAILHCECSMVTSVKAPVQVNINQSERFLGKPSISEAAAVDEAGAAANPHSARTLNNRRSARRGVD